MSIRDALVVQHVDYETIGGFRAPIEAAGYALRGAMAAEMDSGWESPDLLVIAGGPMGVYERDEHPWMEVEIAGVARRIAAGLPTLGICLGAQVMAAALGARVYPGPVRDIGFAPVEIAPAGLAGPLRHLDGIPVLHWHGDTFDLPEGAERLASGTHYVNQAFALGGAVLALQFHAEIEGEAVIEEWLDQGRDYVAGAGVEPGAIRQQLADHGATSTAAGRAMLAEWLAALDR